ncbi:MAG TPA: hypothetical protein VG204_17175 [Terriglobia bacterium]|nr:hypothetical protein [Terriglobia bacterium]
MSATQADRQLSIRQLIFVPALISLGVTLFRLVGELEHWSAAWFTTDMGASIIAIVWLAPVFGVYFALRLAANGGGPRSTWRSILFALLGVAVLMARGRIASALHLSPTFQLRLVFIWSILALAALVTLPGWPALWKTQLAYAYSARIPVAIIMFFAMRGNWGTHYDAAPSDVSAAIGLLSKYLWLGFFPQLVFWVGFTVTSGMLFGTLAAAIVRLFRRATLRDSTREVSRA